MNLLTRVFQLSIASLTLLLGCAAILLAQKPFREYPAMEGRDTEVSLPPDYAAKTEFVLGRLMYPSGGRGGRGGGFGFGGGGGGGWRQGATNWTVDYPKGDRFFASTIRRLTRIDIRSVEQPVNPEDGDDIYNWPYLHVGMPSTWNLSPEYAAKVRDYLLRGGFMLCDSFFGTDEWNGFKTGMDLILPGREIEELGDDEAMFHMLYDLKDRHQVGNYRSMLRTGNAYRADGDKAHWRGIRDDRGRVVVAIAFNSDLGDSWQLADEPKYPEKYSALGIRIGVNYVVYAMTH
jgi:hypothetical protein